MEDRLREIIISIANRCNLRCLMCQIPEAPVSAEMTTAEVKALISDAANFHPASIVFSGGEPLLREDILDLITFVNQRKINTCLTSNGTLIDDEMAHKLRAAGVGVVNISVDGPQEIHESLRGKGNFTKALAALKNLSRHKIETTIATMVCKQNYKFMPYIIGLARQFGVSTVKFQPFSEIFLEDKDKRTMFFASKEQLSEIKQSVETAAALAEDYKITINPANYLALIPDYLSGLWQGPSDKGCAALWSSCPVSSDGEVYPCWVLSARSLGNVKKHKFSEIWNSEQHKALRRGIVNQGCPGCLMSCYDRNLGAQGLRETLVLKAGKFKQANFYKRQYYRSYQSLRYIFNKVASRFANAVKFQTRSVSDQPRLLAEIRSARDRLTKELQSLKK